MNYSKLIKNQISEGTLSFLRYLIHNGGPDVQDYEHFTNIVDNLNSNLISDFREIIKESLNENTLIGHGFVKPYGYPGDFKIIDSIYKFRINKDIRYKNWDLFFQNQPAAHAVRNRKEYFIDECEQLLLEGRTKLKVLILGSGPATDVNEFLSRYPDSEITFDLVDFDQNAIDYARKQNEGYNGSIQYNRINVLRFKPYKTYDLIWSSGLFDYFKDKHFTYLIKKYLASLNNEGTFIIGNFSTINPTKNLMEVLSDWYLNHRSVEDLWRIARQSGANDRFVMVEEEPLGINLFLKIKSHNKILYN
jgi:SAM-dependent methyltransferase